MEEPGVGMITGLSIEGGKFLDALIFIYLFICLLYIIVFTWLVVGVLWETLHDFTLYTHFDDVRIIKWWS